MRCTACGGDNPDDKRFCGECGAALALTCGACGSSNAPGKKFCGDCGAALVRGVSPRPATPAEPSELAEPRPDAERRHLTVMFCDLVGSTELANRLDPEDLRSVIRSYHAGVAAAVAPYDGHVAQLLGDGVLVYFGYPRAHEDDAERAVRAALAVLQAVASLKPHAEVVLQTRIGIATGLVVVGEIGAGTPAAERSASGETPNLAARLQAQARPGEIVIADETRRLVGTAFALDALGRLTLKGFAAPVEAWRVRGERAVATRFEARHEAALTGFVGRDSEVALLLERWALARDGEGQVVLLSGEAGIGKSRICQTLRERIAGDAFATVLLQCSPYFSASALYPVVQHLERAAGIRAADPPSLRAEKVARFAAALPDMPDEWLGSLLRLMGLPDGGRPSAASPQQEKAQTLQALGELLQRLSRQQPVLFLVEDAHWIDPSTEELIGRTIDRFSDASVLMLVTARPEYQPSWGSPAHVTQLRLNRLGQKQCAALVAAVTGGKPLPAEVLSEIVRKTDGVPLFVEELTKTVMQSGLLVEMAERYELERPLPPLAIPATLQDSLMARLDRLAPAKEVAQAGAVIGREFSRALLGPVLASMPDSKLDAALDELVRSELVFRRGSGSEAVYTFKHALIRDTAYTSLLKSQRVLRHVQIAAALERSDAAAAHPELLAHHHQEAGNHEAAFEHWSRAGDLAAQRSASVEAQSHCRAAIALLAKMEAGPRNQERELRLQMLLVQMQFQTHGLGGRLEPSSRARELALALDRPDAYLQASITLASVMWYEGRFRDSIATLDEMPPEWIERLQPVGRARRAFGIGSARMYLGELAQAQALLDEAVQVLEAAGSARGPLWGGTDPMVLTLMCCFHARVREGLLDHAHRDAEEAVRVSQEVGHTHSQAYAQTMIAYSLVCKGEAAAAAECGTRALELADRFGFSVVKAYALLPIGCAQLAGGQFDDGMRRLRESFALAVTVTGRLLADHIAAAAAHALLAAGRHAEAAEFVLAGERLQSESDSRIAEAELLRLRGRLLEHAGDRDAAAQRYARAIEVAEAQGAHWYSLRAATDLAALRHAQGRSREADAVLRPIYEAFTEGFDFPDLKRAKALLDGIAESTTL